MKRLWQALSSAFAEPNRTAEPAPFELSQPLLMLSPHSSDSLTTKMVIEGVLVSGQTGSGKSSASGATLAKAMLRAGFGGIVMCCKKDEAEVWRKYCAQTGRLDSLIVFGPGSEHYFNFLNYEWQRPDRGGRQTESIVSLFTQVIETIEHREGQARGDSYWDRALRQMLRSAVDLLSTARGQISLTELYDLITSAPQSPEELSSESWQAESFCMRCIREGEAKPKTEPERHDFELSTKFWLREYPSLSDRTRSIIQSCFTTLADGLLRGVLHQHFGTRTTLLPEFTFGGAVIVLDWAIKEFDILGQVAQLIFKTIWQRAVERRDIGKYPRPLFCWMDEAQWFLCRQDVLFATTARSARCATVLLTQNLGNFHAALGKAATDTLTGNLNTKIIHRNTDILTNEWCSNLFAKQYRYRTTAGTSTRPVEEGAGLASHSSSGSEALEHQVNPIEFTTLRSGGVEHARIVDAYVFRGGHQFSTGKNYLRVAFEQT